MHTHTYLTSVKHVSSINISLHYIQYFSSYYVSIIILNMFIFLLNIQFYFSIQFYFWIQINFKSYLNIQLYFSIVFSIRHYFSVHISYSNIFIFQVWNCNKSNRPTLPFPARWEKLRWPWLAWILIEQGASRNVHNDVIVYKASSFKWWGSLTD